MRRKCFANGRFLTGQPQSHSPTDLVSTHGRISALGRRLTEPSTPEVDLGGRVVIPGPVDAHCHLVSYGMLQIREADLRGARSLTELAARLRSHAEQQSIRPESGKWLLGRAFDQELLPGGRWPSREDVDAVEPDIPIRISRVCGHALVANSAALRLSGLDANASTAGFPAGVLTEMAMGPVRGAIPPPAPDEWLTAAEWACKAAARAGFVGAHSLMAHAQEVRAILDLHLSEQLPIRVMLQLPFDMLQPAVEAGLRTGFGDDFLTYGAVKLFSDGSLGARTAALRAPYTDESSTQGQLIFSAAELTERVADIYRGGFQACIHAIGDGAMDVTLTAMEQAQIPELGGPPVAPPRIEHASMVDAETIRRMLALGAGAAVQPQFAWSDQWLLDRVGPDRARGCYAFRTLWESGVPLGGSTDSPVEALDAMAAMGAMLHRPVWLPGEELSLETVIRIFSEGSYSLTGRGAGRGRLALGEFADFVVLDQDPRLVPPNEFHRIPVFMTVVDGEIRYPA